MDILNDIDIWLIGLEHNDNLKAFVNLIKSPYNPVLHMRTYKDWDRYLLICKLIAVSHYQI